MIKILRSPIIHSLPTDANKISIDSEFQVLYYLTFPLLSVFQTLSSSEEIFPEFLLQTVTH